MRPALETLLTSTGRLFICLMMLLLFSGCGAGSGQGLDENGNLIELRAADDTGGDDGGDAGDGGDSGDGGALSGNPDATLAWVQSNVFGKICAVCHGGAAPQQELNWSSESNTCSNVGKATISEPSMMEINSGNPDMSYVIWKLENGGPAGEAIKGGQMPLGGTPLPLETIENIRDWIADGTPGCTAPKPSTRAYSSISWNEVWNESLQTCVACHSIEPASPACSTDFACPPNGLVLTEDNYLGVIDGNTVLPFDPEHSSLWNRINARNNQTGMPPGYAVMTQTQIDIIQHWIENGAQYCPEDQVCQ